MKLLITRDTVANGQAVNAGETIEVSERDGAYLIALGKAVAPPKKAEKVEAAEPVISKAVPGGKRNRK